MTDSHEIGVENGWVDLDKDEYSSTVAYFSGGARCVQPLTQSERDDEVLIWQGVSELIENDTGTDHETVFEDYDEVPDEAKYVVNTKKNGQDEPVNHQFAETIEDAKEVARKEVTKLANGDYN